MNYVIYIENLTPNGNASQSSVYYWKDEDKNMTAELAVTGGRTHNFLSVSCSTTQTHPKLYVAWWMLTFPVDTVYIMTVKIYYRCNSKFYFSFVFFNLNASPYSWNAPACCNDILTVYIIDDLSKC